MRGGLHLSDSGADLSESDALCQTDWEQYWARNGERLIWESWIAKYGEYINPDYFLKQGSETDDFEQTEVSVPDISSHAKLDSINDELYSNNSETPIKFSVYDSKHPFGEFSDTSTKCGGLSQCDSLVAIHCESQHQSLQEARQTLSPSSTEDLSSDTSNSSDYDQICSQCDSLNSGIANMTGTTDSMTNVTRITVSSLDFNCDTEDSIPSGSIMSSSGESGHDGIALTEADLYWQELWKKHFQEQYEVHYNAFTSGKKLINESIHTTSQPATINCIKEDNMSIEESDIKSIQNPDDTHLNPSHLCDLSNIQSSTSGTQLSECISIDKPLDCDLVSAISINKRREMCHTQINNIEVNTNKSLNKNYSRRQQR